MAATRNYARDNKGRFHGSSGAAKVTQGKAGGFANASFRQRVLASRGNASPGKGPTGQKASMNKSLGGAAGAKRHNRNVGITRLAGGYVARTVAKDLESSHPGIGAGSLGRNLAVVGLSGVGSYQMVKGGIQAVTGASSKSLSGKGTKKARPKNPSGSKATKIKVRNASVKIKK